MTSRSQEYYIPRLTFVEDAQKKNTQEAIELYNLIQFNENM